MRLFRIVVACIGVVGALVAPVWVPLVAIVILSIRFRAWECLLIGLLIDFIWQPGASLMAVPFFTIASAVIVWGLEPLRLEMIR